jgi:hypothetical protein
MDHRGFPIPWFVATLDTGERDFRVADYAKRDRAVRHKLCWVCGEKCGKHLAFVVGPMCTISRTTSEPPCHLDCAEWSTMNCPFLTRPRMRRNQEGLEDIGAVDPPGEFITRNPGATCIWLTQSFKVFSPAKGSREYLLTMGEPEKMLWYAFGKPATRDQVDEAITSGYPTLEAMAVAEGAGAREALQKQKAHLYKLLDKIWGNQCVTSAA